MRIRAPATVALFVVLAIGGLLRLWFMERWRPALLGFPDSGAYLIDQVDGPFRNGTRPGGYGRFLVLVHDIWPHMSLVTLLQHGMGLATALLLWVAVRRLGGPAWAAVVPAAAVALGGAQIFLEHALMSEAPFGFLVACALVAAVEAVRATRPAVALVWSAAAGVALVLATSLRLPAPFLIPVLVLWLAFAGSRSGWKPRRAGVLAAAVFTVVAVAGVLGLMEWHRSETGRFGLTVGGFYNTYGRVGTFADCSKFTPPAGTAKLCIRVPVRERQGHEFWVFDGSSPLVKAYGPPLATVPPPGASGEAGRFVRAAVLGQPGAYLAQVGRDTWRLIDPGAASTAGRGNEAAGYGSQEMIDAFFIGQWEQSAARVATAAGWSGFREVPTGGFLGVNGKDVTPLRDYERVARFTGPLMALTLLLALAAPLLARPPLRGAALLLGGTGFVLLMLPILATMYDARYVVPALGPLAAAAALGGHGALERVRGRRARAG